jgi:hypothetical protein
MRTMALLRNLEQSLSGLLEGTVGRVFRTEVRPTEIARKLAREMEINKRVSLSRTYAPTDYLVYLSAQDRSRYAGVEASIAEELGAYLLEHARRERLVLVRRPLVEFRTDQRLRLGEFGIEARTAPISAEEAPAREPAPAPEAPRRAGPPREEPQPRSGRASPPIDPIDPIQPIVAEPLGSPGIPNPEEAVREEASALEDDGYADPYAGDPFGGGDNSQPEEYLWEEPAREQPEPEPAAAAPQPAAVKPSSEWLDPVEDWAPQPVAKPEPLVPAEQVNLPGPSADAFQGAPWIDPTLRRPKAKPAIEPASVPALAPKARQTTLVIDGTPFELHGDRVVLGRSRSADVVVSDPSISRQHLELRRDEHGWYAVDLGSTNGSELDGQRLTEPRRLTPGMTIKLGHAAAIIEVR